jgi:O-antigen/teichoic acid export membrane protein
MSVGILGIMALVMRATGRPPEVRALVYLFGTAQFFVSVNATLAALLHARGRVGGMSALAVVTKVLWAAGVVTTLVTHARLWGFAAAYLASESIESVALMILAKRYLGVVLRVDTLATRAMIIGSLPYFLNGCATGAYGKLDVTLLGILSTGPEVGWYVAASSITGLTLLITPLIDWVLTPVFARGAVRSREDLYRHVRQAIEPIVAVAIPAALLVSVGADVWLRLLFGHAFAPAATALRILAASSVVIYVAIVYAMTLIMLGRAWTLTLVSVAALAVNVALNLFLIGRVRAWLGDGGGGVGCAIAALATHVFGPRGLRRTDSTHDPEEPRCLRRRRGRRPTAGEPRGSADHRGPRRVPVAGPRHGCAQGRRHVSARASGGPRKGADRGVSCTLQRPSRVSPRTNGPRPCPRDD